MIIVLEGPDGAGKTTLAQQLTLQFKLTKIHVGPPTLEQIEGGLINHYASLLAAAVDRDVVFDRLALGERVYGPIFRGRDALGASGWVRFDRLLRAAGAVQVLCLPRRETCLGAWSSGRPELLTRVDQFHASYDAYDAMLDRCDVVYDWEIPGRRECLFDFLESWQKVEDQKLACAKWSL